MRIYPDPELPDVEVEWYDGYCADGAAMVLTLTGVDDETFAQQLSVPCRDQRATFEDVARERFSLVAALHDQAGAERARAEPISVDLRNGLDETAYPYFTIDNFSIAWQFESGYTCASTGFGYVSVHGSTPQGLRVFAQSAPCQAMSLIGTGPEGTWNVDVIAYDADGVPVAAAPRIEAATLTFDTLTDLGLVTLAPCGVECP